jgi:hypothetical protein
VEEEEEVVPGWTTEEVPGCTTEEVPGCTTLVELVPGCTTLVPGCCTATVVPGCCTTLETHPALVPGMVPVMFAKMTLAATPTGTRTVRGNTAKSLGILLSPVTLQK